MPWGIWKYFQVDEVSSILLLTNVFANSWNISSINVPKSKLLNRILTYSEKLWVVLVVLKSWRCLSSHVSFSELPIISSGGLLFKKTTANNCDLSIYNISLQKDISFYYYCVPFTSKALLLYFGFCVRLWTVLDFLDRVKRPEWTSYETYEVGRTISSNFDHFINWIEWKDWKLHTFLFLMLQVKLYSFVCFVKSFPI